MEINTQKKRIDSDLKFLLGVFVVMAIVILLLYLTGFFNPVNKKLCEEKCSEFGSYSGFEIAKPAVLICKCFVDGNTVEFEKPIGSFPLWKNHSLG